MGHTLIASRNCDYKQATPEDCCDFLKWSQYVRKKHHLAPALEQLYNSDEAHDEHLWGISRYHRANFKACKNRCFFITHESSGSHELRIGIGPRSTQTNDNLAVLYGTRWPVLLRPKRKSRELIVICYVDGIMYGEAVSAQGPRQDTVFNIR